MTVTYFPVFSLACILICISTFTITRLYYRKIFSANSGNASTVNTGGIFHPARLEISKKELELVFDSIPEQICILDRQYKIMRANKSYSDFAGRSIPELLGKQCFRLIWNTDCLCEDCPVKTTFEKGTAVIKKEFCRTMKDTVLHFEISSFPVFDREGKVNRVIEITKDITEEKRITEQLIRTEKLASIGNMTAGIAHEMNNPLSGISGNATNLLRMPQKYGLNEKGVSRVTAILKSAEHAIAIMSDLLHLSRTPNHTDTFVDINTLIVKTANAVRIEGSDDIERQYTTDDTLPPLYCDPSKIQQVIVHIVTNAVQAIIEKKRSLPAQNSYRGILTVSTKKLEDQALVTVTDNGIGISDWNRSKIFDPFFSTRPPGQGTGLGLSVSNKIVEDYGGRIFFECINGTTRFSILLPLQNKNMQERKV